MNDSITIEKVTKEVIVRFSGKKNFVSEKSKNKIQENWNRKNSDSTFFNGKMYTVSEIYEGENKIEYILDETDYAHYLYTDEHDDIDELCKIIFVSVIIYSGDNKLILGRMSKDTASPGRVQCVGGNIDETSLVDSKFDITKTILQEIQEEIGILLDEKDIKLSYTKVDKDNKYTAMIFETFLEEDSENINKKFRNYQRGLQKTNMFSELSELVYVDSNIESVNLFCEKEADYIVDYLPKLLIQTQRTI